MDKRQDLKSSQLCKLSVPATIPFVTGNAVGVIKMERSLSIEVTFYFFPQFVYFLCVY